MKEFFRSLLASVVALILVGGLGLLLLIGMLAAMGSSSKPVVAPRSVLVLDLSTTLFDSVKDPGLSELIQKAAGGEDGDSLALPSLIQALERAAKDKSVSALYLTGNLSANGVGSGPAALRELRQAIQRFKAESGKPVIAYNPVWTKKEYYLCAGATHLYGHPSGEVDVTGLAAEPMFYGGAFKKYGIDVQVTRVGKFKSAVEPFILDRMSDANREQMRALLGDIWDEWKGTVAADRKLKPEAVQALSDEKGVLTGPEAIQAGMLDRLATPDEVLGELKALTGHKAADLNFPQMDMATYLKIPFEPSGKNRIAIVYAEGEIVDGQGKEGQVGGDRLSRDLRRLRLDKDVKAIVLRVNSPGGSALASELIQREVILARKEKPVVVSMGHLAASGGYWISTYGDRIFAEPNTITGSIGVFGLLPNVKKLANEHGITWDSVQTSRLANPMTLARPKTDAELARIQTLVDGIYDQFLDRVSASRHMAKEKVHEIAQGRVWSGREALKLGLVDELGGLQDAVRHAARMAKIESNFRIDGPGEPKSPIEKILKSLSGEKPGMARAKAGPAQELRGQVEQALGTLLALNDPRGVYARMPFDLALR